MLEIKEEELDKILPSDGPSIDEVKRYLEKYNDEYIVIKCGGSVLVDQNLFEIFIKDININIINKFVLEKEGFEPPIQKMYVDLANQCFKPLSHFSFLYINNLFCYLNTLSPF